MKKKILLIVGFLCIVAVANVYAIGVGVQGNLNIFTSMVHGSDDGEGGTTFAPGFSLLFSPNHKFHVAGSWLRDNTAKQHVVGLTFDFVPMNLELFPRKKVLVKVRPDPFSIFFNVGLGVYTNTFFGNPDSDVPIQKITGGLRVPLGLSFFIDEKIEIFTHVAPSFGVDFQPEFTFSDPFFPVALGLRFWF